MLVRPAVPWKPADRSEYATLLADLIVEDTDVYLVFKRLTEADNDVSKVPLVKVF